MTLPTTPVPGGEAPAAGIVVPPVAPPAGIVPPATPPRNIAEAAQRARELIAKGEMGPTDPIPPDQPPADIEGASGATGDVPVPPEAGADETPPDQNAAPTDTPPTTEELVVALPGRNADDPPFEIEAGDKEAAERLRQLVNGYTRGEQARAIREEASVLRDEAENINYAVQLDPTGFIQTAIQDPRDQQHLFMFLATRPGMLESTADWLKELIEDPDQIRREAAMVEAQSIKRREVVSKDIAEKREIDNNARQIVRTVHKTIESLAPAQWPEEAKALFADDIILDVRKYANANKLRTVDPRAIPGMVQHRLKLMGLAPRESGPTAGTPPAAPTGTPPVAGKAPTPQQFKQNAARRAAAASAPPGAGSPTVASALSNPPAYDPKQPGTPIQQRANWARTIVRRISQRPT